MQTLEPDTASRSALLDPLTGLPNHALFADRLAQAIAHAHRRDTHLALVAIELDAFGPITAALGRAPSDQVIQELAVRLRSTLRSTDTIARIDSTRFAIVVEDLLGDEQALEVALKVREALEEGVEIGTHWVRVTACMGIGIFPRDGHDSAMLVRNADHALGAARKNGHDTITFFDESMSVQFSEAR